MRRGGFYFGLGGGPNIPTGTVEDVYKTGGNWISNARVALQDISIGSGHLEIAAWARNLFDDRGTVWGNYLYFAAGTTYEPARTYGLDMIVDF